MLPVTLNTPGEFVQARNRVGIPTREGITMVLCSDIIRCEADRARCVFYLIGGERIEVNRHLGFYEEKLTEWNFFKVHKSHLVNLYHLENYIEQGNNAHLILSDLSRVPVAVRKRAELRKKFAFSQFDPKRRALEALHQKVSRSKTG